jgi:hypothetical protein
MITNENLRLFVTLERGLAQVRILGARETGELAIMGVAKGADQLRRVLEAGDIVKYGCSLTRKQGLVACKFGRHGRNREAAGFN